MKRMIPRELYQPNESELTLTLTNGTVIWFKGGDVPDSLYGEDVYAAVIDEATRVREDSWLAVRSTLTATKGPIRIIGNVKGRQNWAYRLARLAEAGNPRMHYAKITAYDAVAGGVLDREEIDDAEAAFSSRPEVFRELYMAEPSDDGGNPFGLAAIEVCIHAMSPLDPVAWGWDLAKKKDWTVGIGLDQFGYVCRFERWQRSWEDTIDQIVMLTHDVTALVDSTGVGDPVLEALQRRSQLMEGLAVAIQQTNIHFPDGVIKHELDSFQYEYSRTGVRYEAPQGLNDDCVNALALAQQKRSQILSPLQFTLGEAADTRSEQEIDEARASEMQANSKMVVDLIKRDGVFWPD
jgi:hypothetical protein